MRLVIRIHLIGTVISVSLISFVVRVMLVSPIIQLLLSVSLAGHFLLLILYSFPNQKVHALCSCVDYDSSGISLYTRQNKASKNSLVQILWCKATKQQGDNFSQRTTAFSIP